MIFSVRIRYGIVVRSFSDCKMSPRPIYLPGMQGYQTDDIIYALATGWGKAPSPSSASAKRMHRSVLRRVLPSLRLKGGEKRHACPWFRNGCRGNAVDEVIVSVYRAPHGYTGDDALDISSHGSPSSSGTSSRRSVPSAFAPRNAGVHLSGVSPWEDGSHPGRGGGGIG